MADYEIVCVRKPNRNSPLEHITHVGLANQPGIYTREQIIGWIRSRQHRFYTSVGATTTLVEVVENPPYPIQPYIRTRPNATGIDNLLALPECP